MSREPTEAPSDAPTPAERIWHFLMIISVGSLIAIYGLTGLFGRAGGIDGLAIGIFAVQILPLLAFVPALLSGSAKGAALLSFLSMVYFCAGVLTIVDPAMRLAGAGELFFSMLLFVSATYFTRQRGLRDAARQSSQDAPPPQREE